MRIFRSIPLAAIALALVAAACTPGATPTPAPGKTAVPATAATSTAAPAPVATAAAPTVQPTKPAVALATPAGQAPTATPPPAKAATPAPAKGAPIKGEITQDTVWTKAGSPYVIQGSVTVMPGVTLSVEPGVEVRFAQQVGILVNGKLRALGTADQPIVFTADGASPSRGWWNGVKVSGKDATAEFYYFTIQWAGFAQDGSLAATAGGVVSIDRGVVRDGSGSGMHASQSGLVNVVNTQFSGNSEYALYYDDGSVNPQLGGLTVKGNGRDAVFFGHGIVTGQRTWKNLGVPYVMDSQEVPAGASLTVEPGVVVSFSQQAGLLISGKLAVQGTADNPITFTADSTAPANGWWNGIYVTGKNASADLNYATVQWAGFSLNGSLEATAGGQISLDHVAVRNGSRSGVSASQGGVVNVVNTQFSGNSEYALYYDDGSVNPRLDGLTVKGNGRDAIFVGHGILSGQRTWKNLGVPYVMDNQEVPAGASLTVEPGVVVSFSQQTGLMVNGKLSVQGAADRPVLFTADSAKPNRGYWNGVYAEGNQASVSLQYTTIRWAGFALRGAVDLEGILSASLSNCTLRDSSTSGLFVLSKGSGVTVANCQIFDNEDFGIENNDPASAVNAANCWWGAASGPTADDNPGGAGSKVSEGVAYRPFLTAAITKP